MCMPKMSRYQSQSPCHETLTLLIKYEKVYYKRSCVGLWSIHRQYNDLPPITPSQSDKTRLEIHDVST